MTPRRPCLRLIALAVTLSADAGARAQAFDGGQFVAAPPGRLFVRRQRPASAVHPMSQAPQAFAPVQSHHDHLDRQIASGRHGSQGVMGMLCRVGDSIPQAPTPRRALPSMIRA